MVKEILQTDLNGVTSEVIRYESILSLTLSFVYVPTSKLEKKLERFSNFMNNIFQNHQQFPNITKNCW